MFSNVAEIAESIKKASTLDYYLSLVFMGPHSLIIDGRPVKPTDPVEIPLIGITTIRMVLDRYELTIVENGETIVISFAMADLTKVQVYWGAVMVCWVDNSNSLEQLLEGKLVPLDLARAKRGML